MPTFYTKDIGLAAALIAYGVPMDRAMPPTDSDRRYTFAFTGKNVGDLSTKYYEHDLPVDALTVFGSIRHLKSLVQQRTYTLDL